jgi:hypothetical protein
LVRQIETVARAGHAVNVSIGSLAEVDRNQRIVSLYLGNGLTREISARPR